MTLSLLVSMIGAAFAGAISHELAHWFVWRLTGRKPRLDLWKLVVHPQAGPQAVTAGDRVAAAAPYLIGLCALLTAAVSGSVVAAMFGLGLVQIPSASDVATLRGNAKWPLPD